MNNQPGIFLKNINSNIAYAHTSKTKEEKKGFPLPSDYVTFIKADITNLTLLQNIFQKHKPDYVFHLAAKDATVKKAIFSSSCTVYENPAEDGLNKTYDWSSKRFEKEVVIN